MNDHQSILINPPQMIAQPPQQRMMNPPQQSQLMNPVQPRIMNQTPLLNQSQNLNHPIMIMNQQQPQVMQPLMMNPGKFNPNQPNNSFGSNHSKTNRSNNNWKGKKITTDTRPPPMMKMHNYNPPQQLPGGGYKPPTLNELQSQNRLKTKKFYPKKKYGGNNNRYVPYAPRNTTSFIIRAKKSGGIAELVSPCPVTPAILPTPMFSPSREVLGDMAKEEWGVDGYGSMKGLIRLRSDGFDDDDEGGSSESDVEEHVEVERRLDHDLSRFEMIYPSGGSEYNNVLESRVDDQDSQIAQLEEENLTLKERLFLMERELGGFRRRLQCLERRNMVEEVVENESESEGGSDSRTSGDGKGNHLDGEDSCMQDVAVKEANDVDEAKETQHKHEGKGQGEKEFREVSGEGCEGTDGVMAGTGESKESEMVIGKLEYACI